jgi:hypothetical protein
MLAVSGDSSVLLSSSVCKAGQGIKNWAPWVKILLYFHEIIPSSLRKVKHGKSKMAAVIEIVR